RPAAVEDPVRDRAGDERDDRARGRADAHDVENREHDRAGPGGDDRAERVAGDARGERRLEDAPGERRVREAQAEPGIAHRVVTVSDHRTAIVAAIASSRCRRGPRYGLVRMRIQVASDPLVLDDDLVIAGDNTPVLAALPEGLFDLIYMDPPFNTGRVQARRSLSVSADCAGDRVGFGGRRC